jgi:formylglycine-generating enzyme required for sulfatase activity
MKTKLSRWLVALAMLSILNSQFSIAHAQGTAFTYQGQLVSSGSPATGIYDFVFSLSNAPSGGSQIGGTVTNLAVGVTNGLFTTTLNFGAVFTGNATWLAISVRTNGTSSYIGLTPLQPLMPTPYAIFANMASNLSGSLPVAQLSGTVGNSQLASNSITITAGTGLTGGGTVPLGGSITLNATGSGVASVTGNADITATTVSGAVTLGDTATAVNIANTIVKRDADGNFTNTSITLTGNLNLPATTSAGIIFSGGTRLIHTYGNGLGDFFAGPGAGNFNISGSDNTGVGYQTLQSLMGGSYNTANGFSALFSNTGGSANTGIGFEALYYNTAGSDNTANGFEALLANNGFNNTANGYQALYHNTSGGNNVADGYEALYINTVGNNNTANGYQALNGNISGNFNMADGSEALYSLLTGSNNIALGSLAGYNLTLGSFNIYIGNPGASTDNNIIRIGTSQTQTFIAGVINGNGAGLTNLSLSQLPAGVVTNNAPLVGLGSLFLNNGLLMGGNLNFLSATPSIYAGSTRLLYSDSNNNSAFGLAAGSGGGNNNTAIGAGALSGNATGNNNVATGNGALQNNTASYNTADGGYALQANTAGNNNVAVGYNALNANMNGLNNTASGFAALQNSTASYNTADGGFALQNLQAGNNNIGIGYNAGNNLVAGANDIYIGNAGSATDNNVIRIGDANSQSLTYIAGVISGNGAGLTNVTAAASAIPPGMASIPAGLYTMGDALDGEGDATTANVTVSAFYMDVNLVSYSQWLSVYYWATNNGYYFYNAGLAKGAVAGLSAGRANQPVQTLDWYDAVKWCNARSAQAGLTPAYYSDAGLTTVYNGIAEVTPYVNWAANGYRLPTEAEWEKAARGGVSGQRFPWGNVIMEVLANYTGDPFTDNGLLGTFGYSYDYGPVGFNSIGSMDGGGTTTLLGTTPATSPVGSFAPNVYGLYDMAGNVWEWCWDWYSTPYGQPTTVNPTGPASGDYRVVRGGSWMVTADNARCARRNFQDPRYAGLDVGFRCVRGH